MFRYLTIGTSAHLSRSPRWRLYSPRPSRKIASRPQFRHTAALLALGAGLALWHAGAAAAASESPERIIAAVKARLPGLLHPPPGSQLEIQPQPIDSRLALGACPKLIVSTANTGSPTVNAKVECGQPRWTIYVPVRIHAWTAAVAAAATLQPGALISAKDIVAAQFDSYAHPEGLITDPAAAIGKILRAQVQAGAAIAPGLLDLPTLIRRGQDARLRVQSGALTVTTRVKAMEDGKAGQTILVQNPTTHKTFQATVTADGDLELAL